MPTVTNSNWLLLHAGRSPWAAYVVGHHPYWLRLWQELSWREACNLDEEVPDHYWQHITRGCVGLNRALQFLAMAGQLDSAILIELHRVLDAFEAINHSMIESFDEVFEENWFVTPGYLEWRDLVDLTDQVLPHSQELRLWWKLGHAIAKSHYHLKFPDSQALYDLPAEVMTIPTLIQQLDVHWPVPSRRQILAMVTAIQKDAAANTLDEQAIRTLERFDELSQLDDQLRSLLYDAVAQKPILEINDTSFSFYGITKPLSCLSRAEVACLWMLAENAGRPVARRLIREVGNLSSCEEDLKVSVSRLRKILREIARQVTGEGLGQDARKMVEGFIRGDRGTGGVTGRYTLDIDPTRVRVAEGRPSWMKPKKSMNCSSGQKFHGSG